MRFYRCILRLVLPLFSRFRQQDCHGFNTVFIYLFGSQFDIVLRDNKFALRWETVQSSIIIPPMES